MIPLAEWPQWAINMAFLVGGIGLMVFVFWAQGRVEERRKRRNKPRRCWGHVVAIIMWSLIIGVRLGQTALAEWTPGEFGLGWAGFWLLVHGAVVGSQKMEV